MPDENSHLTFGHYLKSKREDAGLDPESIFRKTKISPEMIKFIENEDHSKLPEPVYVKGFIRAYAKVVGADEDRTLQNYMDSRRNYLEATRPNVDLFNEGEKKIKNLRPFVILGTLALVSMIVIMSLAIFLYQNRFGSKPSESPEPAEKISDQKNDSPTIEIISEKPSSPEQSEQTIEPEPNDDQATVQLQTETGDSSDQTNQADHMDQTDQTDQEDQSLLVFQPEESESTDQPEAINLEALRSLAGSGSEESEVLPFAKKPESLKLSISASAETWIKIIIDEEKPLEYLLKSGDKVSLNAASHYNLLIGNAGGIQMNLNGKPVQIPGKMGQVVNMTLP